MKQTLGTLAVTAAMAAITLAGATAVAAPSGSWSPTASMSVARIDHTATRLPDGRVLVAGGVTTGPAPTATAEVFDPDAGTWSPAASMRLARSRHVAIALPDGEVLVAGGQLADRTATTSAEIYDAGTDTWTPTSSMSVARSNFTATLLLDGRVLVTGGVSNGGVEKSAEIYDPLRARWQPAGKMTNRRFDHAAARLPDGRVLVVGGANASGDCVWTRTAELYTPATGTWRAATPMATPRGLPALAPLPDGRALAAGGLTMPANCGAGSNATRTAELYDASADRWSPTGSMGTARRVFGWAQLIDGRVLVAGGRNDAGMLLDSAELYDSESEKWRSAGSLPPARAGAALTALADRRVLAAGGGGPTPLANADVYTPVSSTRIGACFSVRE